MPRPLVFAVLLLVAGVAPAESPTSVDQIPVIERPQKLFYNAIAGSEKLAVRWEVSPGSVPLGGSLTLTLVVANAANPQELVRPPLADLTKDRDLLEALPQFPVLFSAVEDLPDDPPAPGEVRFRYKVTPRNEGTFRVPELTYRYYQPRAQQGRRTMAAHSLAVPFTVSKPTVSSAPATPLAAPDEFFAVRSDGMLSRSGGPSGWVWVGLFAVGAVVLTGWVIGWRVLFPDAARLAAIRRHRAVRIALDRLRRPHVTPGDVAVTLRNYLIARFGLAFTAQTPGEVAAGLTEVGVSAERAAEAEELLRDCDAARFAGAGDTAVSAKRAAEMIKRWEGVA